MQLTTDGMSRELDNSIDTYSCLNLLPHVTWNLMHMLLSHQYARTQQALLAL